MRARAPSLDRARFLLGISEAVAAADNAHTNVDLRAWREQMDSAPVRFEWFAEGLHVVRALAANEDVLGARVMRIDGREVEGLAKESARYFGGSPEFARISSLAMLESPQALHVLHDDMPADRLLLDVADGAGGERRVELPAVAPVDAPGMTKPGRVYSPVPLPGETPGQWRTVLSPSGDLPPSLRDPAHTLYATRLGDGTLYLHLWQIRDDDTGPVETHLLEAMQAASPAKRIVLDLRFDAGGDYPTVYAAIKALPRYLAPDGRLFVLNDNTTFSAAIVATALARHFAGARMTIVGEPPGDRLAFWSEGNSFTLPNSKVRIMTSTAYHDWAHGCRELRCYWPNFLYDVGVGTVEPQVKVAWRFSDYRRGLDTVLERALAQ